MKTVFKTNEIVASHCRAMDAGTISKKWAGISRQLIKFVAALVAVLCLAQEARAADAITIRDYINGKHPTGDLVAVYDMGYNTVTVTGTVGAAPSTSDYLTLNIDFGVTVIWEANLAGTPSGNFALINFNGGSGIFEMRSGSINNTGAGRAITNNSACAVNILSGTVNATSGTAIYNNSTGAINISNGTVSSTTGTTIHNNSTGTVNVSGGTVSATTGNAIYIASTGVITISGSETRITSERNTTTNYGVIYLANSGTATAARLVITDGTVENTSTSTNLYAYAIYNASTGAVNISGGRVSKLNNSYALYNNSTSSVSAGTIYISGGYVNSILNNGYSASRNSTINISGGTVGQTTSRYGTINISGNATISNAVSSADRGTVELTGVTLNVTGGTIKNTAAGTIGNAIYIPSGSSATINISGGTVHSENGHAIRGYTPASGTTNTATVTTNISGGTVSTNGSASYLIYIGAGTIKITGGTVAHQSNGYAVVNLSSSQQLYLGGAPTITGIIYTYPERFSVITEGDDAFAPGDNIYMLDYPVAQYVVSRIAVTNGWNFLDNFALYNPDYALITSSTHLAFAEAWRVTFNLNGGEGAAPANVSIPKNTGIKVKPPTGGFTRAGYTTDGEWYYGTPSGAAVFIFGEGGTPVTQNTTLFLQWEPVTYTIAYQLDGGTNHPSNLVNYTVESADITLQSPTKDGYAFGGWFDSDTNGNQVTAIPSGSAGNITLWAKWIPIYTITFDATGGMVTPATGTTGDFGKFASLPVPVKADYFFNGWFTTATGGEEVTEDTEFTADATIYARWIPVYTVTFDAAGGMVTPSSGTTGADMTLASLPTPARNGYIFYGWFTTPTDGDKITENTMFSTNTTIYAQWTLITYTVTFNANGGTVTPSSGTTGEGWTLPSLPVPTRNSHVFIGWFTATTDGMEVTENTVFVANATIYARWTPVYTVTFNANGGSVTPSSGTTGTDRTLAFLPDPTRDGYIFNGWFTASTGGTAVTENTVFNANSTIYAQWSLITYTVTFEANGGTVTPSSGTTGVGGRIASFPTPTRTGYTFNGWYTESTGGTAVTGITVFNANTTIYAQWTLITYTITFNAAGGTVTPASGTTGEGWTLAFLPTPTRTGYAFVGWFTATTGGTMVTESTVFSENTTIYAQWTQITNSPELVPNNPLRAWVCNGNLHVTGLIAGETLSVFTAMGTLVYQNIVSSDEAEIPLKVQGVYILRAGDKTVKVMFE